VDKAVQEFIEKAISETYPEHKLCALSFADRTLLRFQADEGSIGEETYAGEKITDAPTWISTSASHLRFHLVKATADASVE
jgi:myo-inositol-1(or 4)-monophosphatase